MHYEEGKYNPAVIAVFSTLEKEQGHQFSLSMHPKQNRARQVLDLLGRKDYGAYLLDVQVLLL